MRGLDEPRNLVPLTLISVLLIIYGMSAVNAQPSNSLEYAWLFEVRADLSIDTSAIVTIYPSETWSSDSLTWYPPGTVSNFAAYDLSTGNPLTVGTAAATNGGTTYTVSFPTDEAHGYQFRIEFLITGMTSRTTSGFSISFGWGGSQAPTPQNVRVELPAGYNIGSVVNSDTGSGLSHAATWDGTEVEVDFAGTAPANGYFDWTVAAVSTNDLPITTTVVSTFSSISTISSTNIASVGLAGAVGLVAGFVLAFAFLRPRHPFNETKVYE